MIRISVRADLAEARRKFATMRKQVDKAAARALNRTADSVKSAAVKEISARTKIKQRDVRQRIYVKGASPTRLAAFVEAFPLAPNLANFRATQNATGVAATAWEGRKTYRGAFIHPKTRRVVTRTTSERFPLKGLRGPSVPRTFESRAVLARLEAVARQRWRTEFERELGRRVRRAFAGPS